MTCDRCGAAVQIGEWPFCPHGLPMAGLGLIDDQLDGVTPQEKGRPRWVETLGHEPVWIDGTKSHLRREAEARGYRAVDRHDHTYYVRQRRQLDEQIRDEGRV